MLHREIKKDRLGTRNAGRIVLALMQLVHLHGKNRLHTVKDAGNPKLNLELWRNEK